MANWSQEMVPNTNLFLIKPFLIAKYLASVSHIAEYDLCQTSFWDVRQNIQFSK